MEIAFASMREFLFVPHLFDIFPFSQLEYPIMVVKGPLNEMNVGYRPKTELAELFVFVYLST